MLTPTSTPAIPPPNNRAPRVPVLNEAAFSWARRGVLALCVAVYLIVFLGGLHAGSEELGLLGRAVALTLVAGVLGRIGLGLLGRSSQEGVEVPMAEPERKIASLVDQYATSNLGEQVDAADAIDTVNGVDTVHPADAA